MFLTIQNFPKINFVFIFDNPDPFTANEISRGDRSQGKRAVVLKEVADLALV